MSEENFSRIKDILAAIDAREGKTKGTTEWREADDQLRLALDNFQFKYNPDEIMEILKHAEKAKFKLGDDFVFKILDKCPDEILDQEAALDLMEHLDLRKRKKIKDALDEPPIQNNGDAR